MKRRKKNREKIILHPVMAFLVLCLVIIIISGILKIFNFSFSYNTLNSRLDYISNTESVNSLLSLRGIKYIFSNTVSNFANFTVLPHLIIILIGIGVMEYSGFLKTAVELLTKKAPKNVITYIIVIMCLIASVTDNLAFIAFIPLSALIFQHGKRNPNIGIVASFASLTCGYGVSALFTSVDSSLSKITTEAASVLDSTYSFGSRSIFFIMLVALIILSFAITYVTENVIAKKVPKYDLLEEEEIDNLTKKELKGLVLAIIGSLLYLIIFIYNIIPGLPFSGNFLNYREILYIDKLFGNDSFFSSGFVFIVAMLFVIWGLLYGIGAKTIKNNKEFVDSLGHSLNGIGKTLVYIFAGATFISIFKQSNIGNVIVAGLTSLIANSGFSGLALVILLYVCTMIATLFVPNSLTRWSIMAYEVIPVLLNAGISAEFTQVVFRFAESSVLGLTPLFAYFIVYLSMLEKYSNEKHALTFRSALSYQLPYSLLTAGILLAIIILWYIISLPLGIGASVAL